MNDNHELTQLGERVAADRTQLLAFKVVTKH